MTDLKPDEVPDEAEAWHHVEAVVRRSRTSFYWAMRLLPAEKRQAMFAVYAFCREVDDIADEPGTIEAKTRALGTWRDDIDALFAGAPGNPVTRALASAMERFPLRRDDFIAVIDGMEMDAHPSVRIADRAELHLYCDRVACAVGRLSNRVFGLEDDLGDPLAAALGEALQLTNILRDVTEDAQRDRIYLPADMLAEAGSQVPVCRALAVEAEALFTEARALIARCDKSRVRPAVMMMEVYHRILHRLEDRGWERLDQPVRMSKAEKLWIAFRHGVLG